MVTTRLMETLVKVLENEQVGTGIFCDFQKI